MNISVHNVRIQIEKTEMVRRVDYHSYYTTVSEETGQKKVADVGVVENETLKFILNTKNYNSLFCYNKCSSLIR